MTDPTSFRDGMAMLTGAVNVVTTAGPAGRAGFTATAVCSVTDQPPTLLVCLNRSSWAHQFFVANKVLCVNVLSARQQDVSGIFANRELTTEQRFAQVAWATLETGSPALDQALVNFDCRVTDIHEVGSHSVFICQVAEIRRSQPDGGLVYFNRAYHHLGEDSRAPA